MINLWQGTSTTEHPNGTLSYMPERFALLLHTEDSHNCLAPTLLIILEGGIVAMRVDLSFGETR